ncbi:MAG TPA: hypothetical protein VGJ26_12715 [Pirellulales bacterium]|jgi:ribosomal protein S27E
MMIFSRHFLSRVALVCFAAVVVLAAADRALACPSCQAALASQEGGAKVVQGFFWSILFMMAMPFSILGGFSTYFYVLVRRARRQDLALAPVASATQVALQRPHSAGL